MFAPREDEPTATWRNAFPYCFSSEWSLFGRRRRMDAGQFATIQELAERHVSGWLQLSYLAPAALKRLTCGREASAVSLYDPCFLAGETWQEQVGREVGE